MAASTQGTAHWFGVEGTLSTLTNATIQSITPSHEFVLNETVENGTGVTVEDRDDNRQKTVSVGVKMRNGGTVPSIGTVATLANTHDSLWDGAYKVKSRGDAHVHNTHVEITLELSQYEGITYS